MEKNDGYKGFVCVEGSSGRVYLSTDVANTFGGDSKTVKKLGEAIPNASNPTPEYRLNNGLFEIVD